MLDWFQVRHMTTVTSFFVLIVVGSAVRGEVAVVDDIGQITALTVEGVFLWIDVPINRFAGGACELRRGDRTANISDFPREKPAQRHFLRGNADGIMMSSPKQDTGLDITFNREIPATVQDTREWKGTEYSAFCRLAPSSKAARALR